MFALPVDLTQSERNFLSELKSKTDKATSTNERIIASKEFEGRAISDRRFTTEERQRILYIISSLKYVFYLSETDAATINSGDAATYVLEVLGYYRINTDGTPNPPEPPKRLICSTSISHHNDNGGLCYFVTTCQKRFLWWNIGSPSVAAEGEIPCPSGI